MTTNFLVSIPLRQGGVFRLLTAIHKETGRKGFNPFETGRGLSTLQGCKNKQLAKVSIPLRQGGVFRR